MLLNTKKHRENLYLYLDKLDLITPIKPALKNGKLKISFPAWDSIWIYTHPDFASRCLLYHHVFFEEYKHIHSYCRNCYKVVVKPRNIVEQFNLYEIQREIGCACKCGMEVRHTTNNLWGGYFYNRGLEAGREKYREVRELVNKHLSPETPVILKRYCTEFELGPDGLGPSDKTPDVTPEERQWELEVEAMFPNNNGMGGGQPIPVQAYVMKNWIHYAFEKHDETYLELTGGVPLMPPYVMYHKDIEEEMKNDSDNS